jgi:hypothetical protein
MRLNKGYMTKGVINMQQVSGVRHQVSGFRGQCSTYRDFFTVLLFYFLKKKKYWNIGTNRSTIY